MTIFELSFLNNDHNVRNATIFSFNMDRINSVCLDHKTKRQKFKDAGAREKGRIQVRNIWSQIFKNIAGIWIFFFD